jgi:hypothetical protein
MKFPLPIPRPSFSSVLKARLAVIAICLIAVAGARLYFVGVDDGVAAIDQESFDSYTHFAQSMKAEKHHDKVKTTKIAHAYASSIWAALEKR